MIDNQRLFSKEKRPELWWNNPKQLLYCRAIVRHTEDLFGQLKTKASEMSRKYTTQ